MTDRRQTLLALAIVAVVIGVGGSFALDDPRLRYPAHLAAMAVAAAGWITLAERGPGRFFGVAILAGVALRIWGIATAPAFSDDVFRYVYEGRVVWSEGLGFPFAHAPAEAPALGVDPALLDNAWLRINHPELATIYPPFAQLTFALAGGIAASGVGALVALKSLLVLADVGVAAILHRAAGPRAAVAWWLCPVVIVEIAREGHADSLSALGLALFVLAFTKGRPTAGYLGAVVAALAKLNGLIVLLAALRATRRGAWVLGALALLALPFLLAGAHAGEGLGAYATRWRAGDGLFSVLLELAELLLGGDWRHVGPYTLTRHQLARGLTAIAFAGVALATLRRRPPLDAVAARAGTLLFALLLLSPTFHPWYVTWLLPFAFAAPGFAWRVPVFYLAAASPLLHHPTYLALTTGIWTDLAGVRALVHGPALIAALVVLVRRARLG